MIVLLTTDCSALQWRKGFPELAIGTQQAARSAVVLELGDAIGGVETWCTHIDFVTRSRAAHDFRSHLESSPPDVSEACLLVACSIHMCTLRALSL